MELSQGSKIEKHNKGKDSKWGPKGGVFKKQKFLGKCINCGKQGHKSYDYRLPKRNKSKEAKVVDNISKDVSDINLTAVISKVNLVGSNPKEWWIDTRDIRHVFLDKKMFSTFEPIETGEKGVYGELFHFRNQGLRESGIEDDVREGADSDQCPICACNLKNLVFGSLLNDHGLRLVFESNKFVDPKVACTLGKGMCAMVCGS